MTPPQLPALADAILAALGEAVLVVDDDRRIVFANPAACDILARDRTALEGHRLDDVVGREALERLDGFWEALHAAGAAHGDLEARYADGTVRAFEVMATASILQGHHLLSVHESTRRMEHDAILRDAELAGQTGTWRWEPGAAYPELSPGLSHLLGGADGEGMPGDMGHVFPSGTARRIMEAGFLSLESGEPFELDAEYRAGDGSLRWAIFRGAPEMDETGRFVALRGSLTDITSRLQAEDLLQRLATDLQEAQRLAHVGSWTHDVTSGRTTWSDEMFRIFGLEPAGEPPTDEGQRRFFDPVTWADHERRIVHALATGEPYSIAATIRRDDGTTRSVVATGAPFRGRTGAIEGIRVTVMDVTEAQELVAALESSEARYRTLIDEIDGIVYLSDLRTGVDFCSDKVRDILGYEPEQMVQEAFWHGLVVEEDRDRMAAFWGDVANIEVSDARYRMRRADGRIIWVEERWRPVLGPDGAPARWCAIVTDVTHRRASEEALSRAERLDAVGRLAAAAAHDFGNVLMAIGMAQGELATLTPEGDERYVEVAAIGEAVRRGTSLTRQMLAFGRDPGEGEVEVIDPIALTHDMSGMLRSVAVPAELVIAARHVGSVLIRRRSMEQAILNLVINARDALAPRGGRITLSAGTEAFEDDAELGILGGRYLCLTIEDNGPGMTEEVRKRALEPFFTTKEQGTGLGLAGVHAAMRKAGGTVRLRSERGAGARVDLLLPLHAEA